MMARAIRWVWYMISFHNKLIRWRPGSPTALKHHGRSFNKEACLRFQARILM